MFETQPERSKKGGFQKEARRLTFSIATPVKGENKVEVFMSWKRLEL